jgi:Domain of unknown function (DUF4082)/Alginate lyase
MRHIAHKSGKFPLIYYAVAAIAACVLALAAVVSVLPADASAPTGLWSNSAKPKTTSVSDSEGIEVGVRFHSTIAGEVTGVQFYKGSGNSGTHVGTLWTGDGVALANVTFTKESKNGWQTAKFPKAIPISANTAYVISYYAPHGHYAQDTRYFDKSRVDGPLVAGASGNGMYLHGSRPRFPIHSHDSDNYWVDVVFTANSGSSVGGGSGGVSSPVISSPSSAPTSSAPSSSASTKSSTPAPSSSSKPAPTSSTGGSASPTPSPTTSASPAKLPSQVLDLTNWKLTLPTSAQSSSTAQEITQPALANFADSPYFMVNGDSTGVVFRANAGGATTSGSGYPRSELREMTGNGVQEASWSTYSGVNTMTVREASTHLPVAKPQVVTAQIHDSSNDIIEVVADGTRSSSPGTYSICVRYNGTTQSPCLDSDYTAGTIYTLTLVASGGQIAVSYNGVQKLVFSNRTSGCYFKAGAYTQSNTSTGDQASAYGEVIIYGLTVTHAQ